MAPDHLRFDFTHPEALSDEEIERIEEGVNQDILGDYKLDISFKPLQKAIDEGATALFGEKYGEIVRNIQIGVPQVFSNELCGGPHVDETGDIGLFLITSEGSAAAGIRRIEAVTGREAYRIAHRRLKELKQTAELLATAPEEVARKSQDLLDELSSLNKEISRLKQKSIGEEFETLLRNTANLDSVSYLATRIHDVDVEMMRHLVDRFREIYPQKGVLVLASQQKERPVIVTAVTSDLAQGGLHAGELAKFMAGFLGGSGGGKPTLAQAGGKDASQLDLALSKLPEWISSQLEKLKQKEGISK